MSAVSDTTAVSRNEGVDEGEVSTLNVGSDSDVGCGDDESTPTSFVYTLSFFLDV